MPRPAPPPRIPGQFGGGQGGLGRGPNPTPGIPRGPVGRPRPGADPGGRPSPGGGGGSSVLSMASQSESRIPADPMRFRSLPGPASLARVAMAVISSGRRQLQARFALRPGVAQQAQRLFGTGMGLAGCPPMPPGQVDDGSDRGGYGGGGGFDAHPGRCAAMPLAAICGAARRALSAMSW